jgi:hypothetical protein
MCEVHQLPARRLRRASGPSPRLISHLDGAELELVGVAGGEEGDLSAARSAFAMAIKWSARRRIYEGAALEVRRMSCEDRMEWVAAVPHNIVGPRQKYDDPYRNVAGIFINLMLQNRPPYIYGVAAPAAAPPVPSAQPVTALENARGPGYDLRRIVRDCAASHEARLNVGRGGRYEMPTPQDPYGIGKCTSELMLLILVDRFRAVKKERIFISGVAGFLGSHLADSFLADGHEDIGIDASPTKVAEYLACGNVAVLNGDIGDQADLASERDACVVLDNFSSPQIDLAAQRAVDLALRPLDVRSAATSDAARRHLALRRLVSHATWRFTKSSSARGNPRPALGGRPAGRRLCPVIASG